MSILDLLQFPALKRYADRYDVVNGDGLEYYPAGEQWSPNPKRRVLQLPRGARPDDIAGEIVSHDLVNGVDPVLTGAYDAFQRSMTPAQMHMLGEQYAYAQAHEGETRPYEQWRKTSGQPAFFRGDLFHQWSAPQEIYTPDQLALFAKTRRYLEGGQ